MKKRRNGETKKPRTQATKKPRNFETLKSLFSIKGIPLPLNIPISTVAPAPLLGDTRDLGGARVVGLVKTGENSVSEPRKLKLACFLEFRLDFFAAADFK